MLAAVAGAWFLSTQAPRPWSRAAAVGTLVSIRVAHAVAWPAAALGVVTLGWRVARGRRLGRPRPRSARALLACGSALVGLVALEVAAAAFLARAHRVSIGPATGATDPDPGAIHLVVIGESSARGVPYARWLSVGRIVGDELGRALSGRKVEVEVLAEDGATLERAARRLDALKRRPDAVIVYAGHNEVCGRFPLGRAVPHYLDETTWADRVSAWVRRASPLDRLIQEGIDGQRRDSTPSHDDRRLVDVPACTPEESAHLLDDFRARLDGLLTYCGRAGVLPILIIPPGNDGGFDPSRSVLDPATPREARERLDREMRALRTAERSEPARCLGGYRAILARHPEFAEAHFRLARLLEGSGDHAGANTHYILARDRDGLPMRCPTPFEGAIRDAARRADGVLVDGPAVLRRASTRGIIDRRLMHDAQHPTLIGYAALAEDLLAQLKRRGAFGWPADAPAPRVDPAACAARYGMDRRKWSVVCYYSQVMWSGACEYRYEESERASTEARYGLMIQALGSGVPPQAIGLLDPAPTP